MRVLLRFSLAFALLVAVLTAIGLVLPGTYRVERTVTVAATPELVYPLVGDLARWREWSPWAARDPHLQVSFSAVTNGAGAWAQWQGANQGGGRAEIVLAQPPERVEYRMTYTGLPVAGEGRFHLVSTGGGARTVITWTSQGTLGWSPLVRWFGLLMKRQEGLELEQGLAALQARVEAASPH